MNGRGRGPTPRERTKRDLEDFHVRYQHQTIELSASKVEGDFDHPAAALHAAENSNSVDRAPFRRSRFLTFRRSFGLLFMALLAIRAIGAADNVSLAAQSPIDGSDYHGFKADWI